MIDGKSVKRCDTGVMSKYLHNQHRGDTVLMSCPRQAAIWLMGWRKQVRFLAVLFPCGLLPIMKAL